MKHEIMAKPDFPIIRVSLDTNESIQAEAGAMVAMSSNIEIETKAKGGILSSAKRSFLGRESFFQNKFIAKDAPGEVYLTSSTPGDIFYRKLNREDLILNTDAYVASDPSIELDIKWMGLKGFLSGEGLFCLKLSGDGDLFFSSFGAIDEINISGDYIVDTGHIVGFETSLDFSIEKVGGLKSLFLSGVGIIAKFQGQGKLYLQTRFAFWVNWRRVQSSK